jgi:hypothetical protein
MKKLLLVLVTIMMAGCAFTDYEGTASRAALANLCEKEGLITYQEFSYYTSFQLGEYAHQNNQTVDDNKLKSMYHEKVEDLGRYDWKSSRSQEQLRIECGNISTVAERVRPRR